MNTGTVKFYNGQKGFGFIQPTDGGKDVFVHVSALERAGFPGLAEGQKLQFELERDTKGRELGRQSATDLIRPNSMNADHGCTGSSRNRLISSDSRR